MLKSQSNYSGKFSCCIKASGCLQEKIFVTFNLISLHTITQSPRAVSSWNGWEKLTNTPYLFLLPYKNWILSMYNLCNNFKAILHFKVTDDMGFKGLLGNDPWEDSIAHGTHPLILLLQGGVRWGADRASVRPRVVTFPPLVITHLQVKILVSCFNCRKARKKSTVFISYLICQIMLDHVFLLFCSLDCYFDG